MKEKEYPRVNPDGDDRHSVNPTISAADIALPAFNPPVPNRAWTAMRMGKDIDELTDEERRMLYYGRDGIL